METMDSEPEEHYFDFSSPWHFSDVVLVAEGTKFHVHKSTLSMWSHMFERMFAAEFMERQAQEIPLPGKKANELKVLLRLVYSYGNIQKVNEENCSFLLKLADEYQMDKVRTFCSEFLLYNIQQSNVTHIYKLAEQYHLEDVMKLCVKEACFMTSKTMGESEEFASLKPEGKLDICMERIKELEHTLSQYATTCSKLIEIIYKEVARVALADTDCDNIPVHTTGARDVFKMSCKCCRRRVQNCDCSIEYYLFKALLTKLFDLEHYSRMARNAKNSFG